MTHHMGGSIAHVESLRQALDEREAVFKAVVFLFGVAGEECVDAATHVTVKGKIFGLLRTTSKRYLLAG